MTTSCIHEYATIGEARIARKLVKAALDADYSLSVYDGEEWTVKRAWRMKTVLEALATTGEDTLCICDEEGTPYGSFYLVWGNAEDGSELIADHTDNVACNDLVALVEGRAIATPPAWHGEA
jgi:hypothetical protein